MTGEIPAIAATAPVEVAVECGRTYWWCACGRSKKQPFCDGSHRGTSFSPLEYQAPETGTTRFCVCKRTATPPFCDGANHICTGISKVSI